MSTTAVSFRKGNTEENNNFAGVAGEIVADLGANEQVTENATIVLHTGNGEAGGIRMARQDLNNITNESISNLANFRQESGQGTYYGLLRRNMSNYISNNVNPVTVENLLKSDYNIASRDGSDINTSGLAGQDGNSGEVERPENVGGKYLLNRDLSNLHANGENVVRQLSFAYWLNNINSSFFGNGTFNYREATYTLNGKKLAYFDMSNVDTASLATGTGQPGEHTGKNLAYSDLSNVGYGTITSYLNEAYLQDYKLVNYEWIENKANVIDKYSESDLNTQYPSVQAVIDYNNVLSDNYANRDLDNIQSWAPASYNKNFYKIIINTITDGGSAYVVGDIIPTNIERPDYVAGEDPVETRYIKLVVDRVSSTGEIIEASIESTFKYSMEALPNSPYIDNAAATGTKHGTDASFILSSREVVAGRLMLSDLSNSEFTNSTDTQYSSIKYKPIYDINTGAVVSIASLTGTLADDNTETQASFAVKSELAGVTAKLSADDSLTQKSTILTVTKNNAYLNKVVSSEAQDADHQLLNRAEMDARYQLQPSSATQDNIATFNGSKSTIDSGKAFTTTVAPAISNTSHNKIPTEYAVREAIEDAVTRAVVYKGTVATENDLPASGNTNGDLYWIQAFSSNPPAGMTAGHGGTAIWNANYATPTWDFKEDTINDPDGQTIQKNSSTGKIEVMLSATANNAIAKNNDGLYVNSSNFVPSSGYVAVAAVSGQSGKVLTNNGTNTSWRTATPEPPITQGIYHLVVDAQGNATWVNDNRLELGPSAS